MPTSAAARRQRQQKNMAEFIGRDLPLRTKNVIRREAWRRGRRVTVRSMRCGRGCAHGRAFPWRQHIRLYLSSNGGTNLYLVIHEMAHLAGGVMHDDGFYREAIRIAKREGVLRAWLDWSGAECQGRVPAAEAAGTPLRPRAGAPQLLRLRGVAAITTC